ncbi:MAG: putative cytokinetic ring protein SteA [Streptosporangiaceae bacterium]
MKVLTRRRSHEDALPGITAPARLDRRTKNLTKRLKPGEVAVVDHLDLDRVSAETLVSCGAAAVVNAAASVSGRYPNLGPEILMKAGVPLLDGVGPDVFAHVDEGQVVRVQASSLYVGDRVVATGTRQTLDSVAQAKEEARSGLAVQLEAFAANTMEYLKQERELLLDGVGVPEITTALEGRHVLVVVRGYNYREDLQTLRPYIREYRPVLLAVDGGADALVEAGYKPDLIVGDMDSVSDEALGSGAELVVHAYRDGRSPGLSRVRSLGLEPVAFPATGTSEDIAMLLADDKGASLIVVVGTHASLVEFLDKGRAGMASSFLTRLRVGGKLVDAKGVSRLYRSRISASSLFLLVFAALVTFAVAVGISPMGRLYATFISDKWNALVFWVTGLFT